MFGDTQNGGVSLGWSGLDTLVWEIWRGSTLKAVKKLSSMPRGEDFFALKVLFFDLEMLSGHNRIPTLI